MAQITQDPRRERIEIVDQPENLNEQESSKSWLSIPIALVIVVALFFLVRRITSKKEL